MKTLDQLKECGAKACAMKMYQDGQGQESNPYPKGSPARDEFSLEMGRLQQHELSDLMGWQV